MLQSIRKIIAVLAVALISGITFGQQNDDCGNLEPICTESGVQFTALSGVPSAQSVDPGNNYNCLTTTPNPTWYYMEVGISGNLIFDLNASFDIDFIIYGPFADSTAAANGCGNYGNGGSGGNVIDCSYSPTNLETPQINGAVAGEIYVLLITNYAAQVQPVNFSQSNFGQVGAGELDCPIIPLPCVSNPGTFVIQEDPLGAPPLALALSPLYLCEGDAFQVISNDDYILPNDTIPQPIGDGIYSAQLMWLVYDAVPIILSDPGADPGFLNYIIPAEDLLDVNDASSPIIQTFGCGTYWFVPVAGDDGIGGNNNLANGTNDNGGLDWDKNANGCYLLGTPIEVTYACAITTVSSLNCNPPLTINGMDIDISGGSGTYTIVNQGGGNLVSTSVNNGGTATVVNLNNASNWSIDITDAQGCYTSASGTFAAPVITDITLTPAPDCPLGGNGDVDVTVSGTSGQGGPYTIIMAGDPPTVGTTDSYSDLAGTLVPIVVSDVEGCISDSTVTIPSAGHFIDVTITNLQGEFCWGDGNGTATITAVPTPSGNVVTITWIDPLLNTYPGTGANTTQAGMMPGVWTVCITDDVGCEVCIPIEITAPQELDVFVENSNEPVCYLFSDGSIDVGVSGGTQPINFSWSHNGALTGDVANTVPAGDYWAYVTDDNGCMDSVNIILGQPDSIWADYTIKDVLCNGDFTGGIIIDDVHNAYGNYTYNWNLQGVIPNPADSINIASGLPAGTYVMTLLDENGCSKEYEWTLTENPPIILTEFASQAAYCRLFGYQSGNGVISVAAAGGVPDYDYQWMNLGDGSTWPNTTWGGLNPGTYQITVVDDVGCVLVNTINVDSVNPIADFTILSAQLDANNEGTATVFASFTNQSQYFANPNNPQADTTFFWNLNYDNTDWYISHDLNEVLDTSYTGEEIYQVCLVAINKNGCTDTTCKLITVHEQPIFVTPNVFTPGTDGSNDVFTFEFKSQAVAEISAVIVDRWGTTVFQFNDITDSWNGDNSGGSPCNDGTYFYVYDVVFTNGETAQGQGTITLLRE